MKFTRIFVVFVTLFAAAACSFTELDDVTSAPEHGSQYLQVVGRVAQYSDCDVATRSKKEDEESKITSMGLALFPIENGAIGNCLYYDFQSGSSIVFIIDRHDDVFDDYVDKGFAMYVFANMQDAADFPKTPEAGVGKSLEYFTKRAVAANDRVAEVPVNGFPMIGSVGNTVILDEDNDGIPDDAIPDDGIPADGVQLILKPALNDSNNVDGLPLLDGSPIDNIEIPLKSMYAKFTFTISVKPDQEVVGNRAPRFDLLSYEVKNIANTVDANLSTNDATAVIPTSGEISMGNYAQGATTVKFDFYLPERYLHVTKSIDAVLPDALRKGIYDTTVDADQNGYRDIDEKYHQRYKNLLPDSGEAATYVIIKGKYTDHQGNIYDVDYNIYVGANNYDDFDIIRNTHYDNSITIRGILNSSDQALNDEAISIDWRVNVERSTPLVIGLRRESLLDAHFEVRPLRLRLVGDNIPTGTSATVQILNESGKDTDEIPDWIRLEKSGSTSDHITTDDISAGKRKYFTTDLVTKTLADGTSVTMDNLNRSNQTVWIYVDENTSTSSREALLRVTYGSDVKEFKIVQHGLFKVVGADSGKDYYIEKYEEYLYNYDAEDSYGQIKEEGMPWGLPGVQLSNEHQSFTINEDNTAWRTYIEANPTIVTYDFYTWEQDSLIMKNAGIIDKLNDKRWHEYAGQHFTGDIYKKSNGEVRYLSMDQQASGAVEYCYSRNKRNADGSVEVKWYLPSAGELEDFIVAAYSSFEEFQDNYYWTSQPAYTRNAFYYEYKEPSGFMGLGSKTVDTYAFIVYEDNTDYARATKVKSLGNDKYGYASSGLNDEPNEKGTFNGDVYGSGTPTDTLGYFKTWRQWKKPARGDATTTPVFTDQWYWDMKDEQATNILYYAFVNENYFNPESNFGMLQEGYHPRTKNNRVRCVRKMD